MINKGDRFPLAAWRYDTSSYCFQAEATGEFRPPKTGEHFLSGAIVEGYEAHKDLETPYYIAKKVGCSTD